MNIPRDWTFKDAGVAAGFDKHVREQLPWYDLTTGVVAHFARHYIPERGVVYDIGASTGNIARAMEDTIKSRSATLIGIDASEDMVKRYTGPGTIVCADAAKYDFKPFDFAVCFLVLMFLKPSDRANVIRNLRRNVNSGGAILIIDKCQPVAGYPSVIMQRLALAGKIAAGVSADEVIAKELSLAGAQRPLARNELPPQAIEIFRFGDFAGWIIEASYPTATENNY